MHAEYISGNPLITGAIGEAVLELVTNFNEVNANSIIIELNKKIKQVDKPDHLKVLADAIYWLSKS